METLQRTANRGSVPTGFTVDNSLKLERDNSEYLNRSQDNGNRRTWTFSGWWKETMVSVNSFVLVTYGVNNQATRIFISSDNSGDEHLYIDLCDTGTDLYRSISNAVFRDVGWNHLVVSVDTTQGTAANRMKAYINGVEVTSWESQSLPTQNLDTLANVTGYGDIGIATYPWAGSSYDGCGEGYICEHVHIDGLALTPTSFGEFDDDGVWIPKDPSSLTFGTNGHYLKFDDSSSLGADSSGNSNNFTLNNINAADQALDTCTNTYPVIFRDHLFNLAGGDNITSRDGGTLAKHGDQTGWATAFTTLAARSGKWYAEYEVVDLSGKPNVIVGVFQTRDVDGGFVFAQQLNSYIGVKDGFGVGFYFDSADVFVNNGTSVSHTRNSLSSGDIVGVAMDLDNSYAYFSINNQWVSATGDAFGGDPTSGSSGTGGYALNSGAEHAFAISLYNPNGTCNCNFGGYTVTSISSAATDVNNFGKFEFSPPTGYLALCTQNLKDNGG